jgi:hypothetical protein
MQTNDASTPTLCPPCYMRLRRELVYSSIHMSSGPSEICMFVNQLGPRGLHLSSISVEGRKPEATLQVQVAFLLTTFCRSYSIRDHAAVMQPPKQAYCVCNLVVCEVLGLPRHNQCHAAWSTIVTSSQFLDARSERRLGIDEIDELTAHDACECLYSL